jgi:hypothetical protein
VNDCAAAHFRPSDVPMLAEYARTCMQARVAAGKMAETGGPVVDGQINAWFMICEKLTRRMAVLAMRLRLTPASRMRPETLARQRVGPVSYYETMGLDDA